MFWTQPVDEVCTPHQFLVGAHTDRLAALAQSATHRDPPRRLVVFEFHSSPPTLELVSFVDQAHHRNIDVLISRLPQSDEDTSVVCGRLNGSSTLIVQLQRTRAVRLRMGALQPPPPADPEA